MHFKMKGTFTNVLAGFAAPAGARTSVGRPSSVLLGLAIAAFAVSCPGATPGKPAGMAWIPGGEFAMGTDEKDDCLNYRPSSRRGTDYDTGMSHLGFRCVLSPGQRDSKTTETSTDKTTNRTTNKP